MLFPPQYSQTNDDQRSLCMPRKAFLSSFLCLSKNFWETFEDIRLCFIFQWKKEAVKFVSTRRATLWSLFDSVLLMWSMHMLSSLPTISTNSLNDLWTIRLVSRWSFKWTFQSYTLIFLWSLFAPPHHSILVPNIRFDIVNMCMFFFWCFPALCSSLIELNTLSPIQNRQFLSTNISSPLPLAFLKSFVA